MRRIGLAVFLPLRSRPGPSKVAIAVFGTLLFAAGPPVQADAEFDRQSLVGLKGVYILIEDINPEVERDGLSRVTRQTDVDLKLRQAGITVYTREQSFSVPGSPYLYLAVNILKTRSGLYAYAVALRLAQSVTLSRAPHVTVTGATWHSGAVGVVGGANLSQIRDAVRDVVDQFLNAYLAANPKN